MQPVVLAERAMKSAEPTRGAGTRQGRVFYTAWAMRTTCRMLLSALVESGSVGIGEFVAQLKRAPVEAFRYSSAARSNYSRTLNGHPERADSHDASAARPGRVDEHLATFPEFE